MRLTLLAALASFMIGCSRPAPTATPTPNEGHDHGHGNGHDHVHDTPITKADVKMPASFAELVSRIEQYRDEIKAAIDAGKPESGHRALDELDIVLGEAMSLAQESVPEDQLAAVNEARQSIRNAFLEIHQSIDAKEKPDFAAKEQAIQIAITSLKTIASVAPTQ
jgi:hypothetical protein